jgi:hypothetical protein
MQMSVGRNFLHGGNRVIHLRHERPSLWHAGLAKDIEDLWEPWMREADRLLEDATLVEACMKRKGSGIRRADHAAGHRRLPKWLCLAKITLD